MNIPLEKLQYAFVKKPLVVGGMAMEYYGVRPSGKDIDLVVAGIDFIHLLQQYPTCVKNLWEDIGVCPFEFEIWKTINYDTYEFLSEGAIDEGDVLVISLEKLLYMKTLAKSKEKYANDMELLVKEILKRKNISYEEMKRSNESLLQKVGNVTVIEQSGPTNV